MGLDLRASISLDGSGFERGLHRASEHVTDFAKNAVVAAFGIYGVEEAIKKTVETATELVNTSKRLDVSVEQLQLLRQAAKDGGTEMEALASAMEKIDVARGKIMRGDEEGKKLLQDFERLGVSEKMLQTQTAASLLMGPISQTVKGENVENIAVQLKEILGKGMGQLVPVLKTDFEELEGKMKSLGSIMDTETAVKLKALGDNFELLKNILAAQLGPVLLTLVEAILMMIGKIKGAGAFWGTVTEHLETLTPQTAKAEVLTSSGKINFWKALWAELNEGGAAKPEVKNTPASDAAQAVEDDWTKHLEEMRKKLKEEADKISHPKPINPENDDPSLKKGKHIAIPSDALVKVGNFLGANGNTISKVDQQKIALMKDHLNVLNKIEQKLPGTGGNFGTMFPIS